MGVSCAKNSNFCEAVGSYDSGPDSAGVVQDYNGTSWSITGGTGGYGYNNSLPAVSCASPTFCAAAGSYGDRSPYGSWLGISYHGKSAGGKITDDEVFALSGGLNAVACAESACVAAGDGNYVFNVKRTHVSGPSAPNGLSNITALACSSSSLCWAINNGNVLEDNRGAWSVPVAIDPASDLSDISCPARNFCVAVDASGDAVVGT